jgi:2-polyprenyl-3-methyl-5-hydroxy-6-metoxy-1,4-benzoquinol methylase
MAPKKIKAWELPRRSGETDAEFRERKNRCYFDQQIDDNREWWRRIGSAPDLSGKRVLEIGCGHGALSIDAAQRGAAFTLGIDTNEECIAFANVNLANYPSLSRAVSFSTAALSDIATGSFDIILSKDCFEHVIGLPEVMTELKRILADGGVMICGFSPLYYSPWGDHGRTRLRLPWLHAILPESAIRAWLHLWHGQVIQSIADLGLNKITLQEFESLIHSGVWQVESMRINPHGRTTLISFFNFLRRIPALERFFTVSIYAILVKTIAYRPQPVAGANCPEQTSEMRDAFRMPSSALSAPVTRLLSFWVATRGARSISGAIQ